MGWLEALILGILQGLTEFLPVSSSGHLELGQYLLNKHATNNLVFTVVVHGATVLSTIVVFRKDIWELIQGLLKFEYNTETRYVLMIFLSMLPVLVLGLFFKDSVESLFSGNIMLIGFALLFTALVLAFTYWAPTQKKAMNYKRAFVIGLAQAVAVVPGVSRSGTTISTALLLGVNKEKAARFSFLMVLLPIIGANFLGALQGDYASVDSPSLWVLGIGFLAAFLAGLLACTWMINIVKKGKLIWFAVYCAVIGLGAVIFSVI
ncbi:MAG: undecaprenyl-diphosphate phosphatase [Bacteroidota bacterium]|nr:undecaprenyl-diphosphate phosphatase [Bacteroidota bacterium]